MTNNDAAHRLRMIARLDVIALLLDETYGPFVLQADGDALAQLVATILSQHTSDINTARSFASLRATFPTWEDVEQAPTDAVIDAIRSGGLATSKAPRIQDILSEVKTRNGAYDIDGLADLPLPEATRWLTSLHGVGPKTAACVLLFALGMPAMPVDTHVHRLSRRLGFVSDKTSAEKTEIVLEEMLGDNPQRVYAFHKGLIAHGKTLCKARVPLCAPCPLKDHCDYYSNLQHE